MRLKEKVDHAIAVMKQVAEDLEVEMIRFLPGTQYKVHSARPLEDDDFAFAGLAFEITHGKLTHTQFNRLSGITGFRRFLVHGPEGSQAWPTP